MDSIPRRQAIKTLGAAGAGALIGASQVGAQSEAQAGPRQARKLAARPSWSRERAWSW